MNVTLRPIEDRDLDALFEQWKDPESIRLAAFTSPNQNDREAFDERMSRLRTDQSVTLLAIDVDGTAVGTIGSFHIDGELEVTYWVDRAHWGKGIATAALQLLLADTAERPVFGRAASDNAGSLRVLEKVGFHRIGVDRGFANGRGEDIEETILRLD
ncbi:MAG TPA: GNAT family N-acetyltransferase [Gaiellaceae bacterium]|nr:GNAT family N-acetyltransferase [Gaiellaceae bacterium]